MFEGYYNYYTRLADSWWERRDFVRGWRRLHGGDRRWVPPYYPLLMRSLSPDRFAYMDRQQPASVWIEALHGRPNTDGQWGMQRFNSVMMEESVAVATLLADPRRRDDTATMAMLSVANDVESAERLLMTLQEQAYQRGCSRLIGPTALSPHLGYGALLDHFDKPPPLHTPYNAPYLPEILDAVLARVQSAHLYHYHLSGHVAPIEGPAHLRPMVAADDAKVLPNVLTALDGDPQFPRPDLAESAFLLAWWGIVPRVGWIAEVDGEVVGFVWLQPDLAPALRRAKGGRNWLWRTWWLWRRTRPVRNGRVVAIAVMPRWRRQGIGRQLWAAALNSAYFQGWRNVSIGPVVDDSVGAKFLLTHEATPLQHYALYGTE